MNYAVLTTQTNLADLQGASPPCSLYCSQCWVLKNTAHRLVAGRDNLLNEDPRGVGAGRQLLGRGAARGRRLPRGRGRGLGGREQGGRGQQGRGLGLGLLQQDLGLSDQLGRQRVSLNRNWC